MIRYITAEQLTLAQKKFYYKAHKHQEENIFLASPPDYLNPRAYQLCRLCGQLKVLQIDKTIEKEIKEIIDKKIFSLKPLK